MRTHCITIDLANQGRRQVRARFDGGRMSSDGGALLLQAGPAHRPDPAPGRASAASAGRLEHPQPARAGHPRLERGTATPRRRRRCLGVDGTCRDEFGLALAQNARRYRDFRYRTLASWSRKRRVVGKVEWLPGGVRGATSASW